MAGYRVTPRRRPIDAVVHVPGSKSVANRALICAALADGTSTFDNLPDGDDSEAMLVCLGRLGIDIDRKTASSAAETPPGRTTTVRGTGGALRPGPAELPTRLAGTTSRFVTALAALGPGPYVVDGDPPLRARPMAPLHDALRALGTDVVAGERDGHLPATIGGPVRGGGRIDVPGDISSQFITALMLIGPYIPDGLRVSITTPLVSRPYLEITRAVMADFGHRGVTIADDHVEVLAGQYEPRHYAVEPDATSAGYPLAAAAICGGRVEVPGLTKTSIQGDAAFGDVLGQMGCAFVRGDHSSAVESGPRLRGVDIDMVDFSDLVPTLAAVATFAESSTRIRGVAFIRAKESDRLGDLCRELLRVGADARETSDGLIINPSELHGGSVDTHHDHRLAMAFGLIGLRVAEIEIVSPGVVTKSWPGYWTMLEELR